MGNPTIINQWAVAPMNMVKVNGDECEFVFDYEMEKQHWLDVSSMNLWPQGDCGISCAKVQVLLWIHLSNILN